MADHHHHHGSGCCSSSGPSEQNERILDEQLDAAGQSLRRALKMSFTILKGIIAVLLVVFACSGIFQVQQDEEAILLQFGKIKGPVIKPGIKFAFPEPINEIIRIPVQRELSIPIESFWYYETPEEKLREFKRQVTGPLDPLKDGYCLTRNDNVEGMSGTDYNIVHSAWTITYKISSPKLFFENVYIRSRKPGEDLLEAAADTLNPLLESLASNAIVRTMVQYSIDEAVKNNVKIAEDVKYILQDKLDQVGCGIQIGDVRASQIVWPRQVDQAFQASSKARQESDQIKTDAASYKEQLLTDTGGSDAIPAGPMQRRSLTRSSSPVFHRKNSSSWLESFPDKCGRRFQRPIFAEYLRRLLPEYRKNQELVLQKIYQDAIEQVLAGADEKIFIQTREGMADEIRVLLNRDPNINKGKAKQNNAR
ncbi:MAG: SPFH domain-containing protein [Planctomycetota bacterium]|jgi:regulator of protease activity HflC (stomatin/prohibitin superfamily)